MPAQCSAYHVTKLFTAESISIELYLGGRKIRNRRVSPIVDDPVRCIRAIELEYRSSSTAVIRVAGDMDFSQSNRHMCRVFFSETRIGSRETCNVHLVDEVREAGRCRGASPPNRSVRIHHTSSSPWRRCPFKRAASLVVPRNNYAAPIRREEPWKHQTECAAGSNGPSTRYP